MERAKRIRSEGALAALFAVAAVATAIWPEWIEELTGLEPDGGSGELEWLVVAVLGAVALLLAVLARRDILRTRREQFT